jgi:hypothetical protein
MISSEVQRTLVKSPPELWAELGDPAALARHLGELGEIRIVRSEPETHVEWEAEGIGGTIRLEPSGWGTKVTLTATRATPTPEPATESQPASPEPRAAVPEPTLPPDPRDASVVEVEPEPRRRFFARLFRRRRKELTPEPTREAREAEQESLPDIAAELQALEESLAAETAALLTAVLDRLGAAHHRPFSRA